MALTKVTGQVVNTSTDLTVGVLTATTASFTGNVSVGGTLTYEDVTNVDSVGLITARNGIEVTDKGVQVGTGATVDSAAANTLTFLTNGSERVRVTSAGLVGIGTVTPARLFHLHESNSNEALISFTTPTTGATVSDGFRVGMNGSEEALVWNNENGVIKFGTDNTERLRIDSSGRLLLGTTTEGNAGADDLTIATSGNSGITIRSGTSDYGNIYYSDATSGTGEYAGYVSYQHSTNSLQFATDSTERMRIDSSGRLLLGTTTAQTLPTTSHFQVSGNSFATSSIRQTRFETAVSGPSIILAHARGTEASPTILSDDDELGKIRFYAHDGVDFSSIGAEVRADVDGTPGSDDTPGRLVFSTTADGADTLTERMRIDSSGNMGLGTNSPSSILHIRKDSTNNTPLSHNYPATQSGLFIDNQQTGTTGAFSAVTLRAYNSDSVAQAASIIAQSVGGSGLAPSLLFTQRTSSGNNTERMRIDNSGRVGINNTSPGSQHFNDLVIGDGSSDDVGLTIHTSTSGSGTVAFSDGTSGADRFDGYLQYDHFNQSFKVYTNGGNERMRIDSSGRLLVGLSAAAAGHTARIVARNDVDYTSTEFEDNATLVLQNETNNNSAVLVLHSNDTSGSSGRSAIVGGTVNNGKGKLGFYGSCINKDSSTDADVTIDADGRLLVGATSPADSNLNANLEIRHTSTSEFILSRDDSTISTNNVIGRLRWYGNDGGTYHEVARLSVAAADAHSNTSKPGQFIFATTATSATSPTDRFRIDNLGRIDHFSSDGNGFDLHHAETGASDIAFQLRKGATSLDDGTACMQILADGDVENTNNRYTQISDIKFKENIVDASSQWEDFKAIRVVNFNFKAEKNWGTHRQIGVIAQEIETVSPGLICQRREENGEEYKSVAYSVLYMKAVKALQEAQTRIETLEAKVAALEG